MSVARALIARKEGEGGGQDARSNDARSCRILTFRMLVPC